MNVLVINAGSSSLKYQLLDTATNKVYAKGNCERIGIDGSFVGHEENGGPKQKLEVALPDHKTAIKHVFEILDEAGFDTGKIQGIGHRVVQGGWYFPESKIVTDETLGWVREVAPLAPLHNYAEADVIEICRDMFPSIGNVIVADTSFHYGIPEKAYRYALPRDVVDRLHIRKYGAHGTSHRFIWRATAKFTDGQTHKLVSCHLGSGASLAAIQDGKDMDTTMGLTPLDGLIMGTRCGTIDPSLVSVMSEKSGYRTSKIIDILNKQAGLVGISGVSSDMRDLHAAEDAGNERAKLAVDILCYQIKKYIGSYAAALGGLDAVCFTGGIGENDDVVRERVCENMEVLGIKFDSAKNSGCREEACISTPDSKVAVWVLPTNEELLIARDTKEIVEQL